MAPSCSTIVPSYFGLTSHSPADEEHPGDCGGNDDEGQRGASIEHDVAEHHAERDRDWPDDERGLDLHRSDPGPSNDPADCESDQERRSDGGDAVDRCAFVVIATSDGDEDNDGSDVGDARQVPRADSRLLHEAPELSPEEQQWRRLTVGIGVIHLLDQTHHEEVVACVDDFCSSAVHPCDGPIEDR